VADIILAVDEPIDATQCGGLENCHDDHKCLTHDLWSALNARIFDYLRNVKLSELVARQHALRAAAAAGVAPVELPVRAVRSISASGGAALTA
jgi:Rrf2 family iron-sulfur cluster assembly transcriptional regulator